LLTLGIDPGTAIMGYGLVASDGRSLHAIDYGALTTPSDLPPEERLRRLHERLCEIIAAHRPDAMAVEELFFNANARTAIAVGQARGVALLAAAQAGLRVHEYTPLQVKGAVAGYGRAGKEQVQLMAATLLSTMFLTLPQQLGLFTAILLVHNSFGAMQDVAIDALAVNTLHEDERGLANGLMFCGASIGQLIGGSGVLFMAPYTGFQPTFFFVAGSILVVTVLVVLPLRIMVDQRFYRFIRLVE